MELNRLGRVLGVVVTEDILEGRAVVLKEHSLSHDFGSWEDLPGVGLPQDATEGAGAQFVLMFAPDNRQYPVYQPTPHYDWAMRGGYDKPANAPFAATVYLTPPGNYATPQVVASGTTALALGSQTKFTVGTDGYIADANIKVGAELVAADAANDGADAGKLKYSATGGNFVVIAKDSDGNITVMIK